MSLVNLLRKKTKMSLFTTPSHAQKLFLFPKFRQFYKYDISETDSHNPQDALNQAQKKAAEIYKTKSTFFLTNGSTSGIIAAVLACIKPDEKVLIWDNAHRCHQNAVKLSGAKPVFYNIDKIEDWGIYGPTPVDKIEEQLKKEKISAVIVTSPTYEGVVSDIKAISKICKKLGVYLIIDEAHGALYPFCERLPESAIYCGADFVIQSLHKTAGGLNPTALLHCNIKLGEDSVQGAIDMVTTTSPSYPLLASIEKNISYLNSKRGRKAILDLIENIEKMKKHLPDFEFYDGDVTKILVKTQKLSGYMLSEYLYKKKIEDEITNGKSTMLLCGLGTGPDKLLRLEKVLKAIR